MYSNVDYALERENMKRKYGCDTMCTAKFFTSTIYLQSGQTHSCYHPLPHKIPLEEIKNNPSALHNTKHKIERRKQMMLGQKPEECNYCWRVEAILDPTRDTSQIISDRIIKSKNELLLTPDAHEQILANGWDHNYRPTYLEISFGNECNMKCAYCHPKASSAWQKEMNKDGPMYMAEHLQSLDGEKIYAEDDNPYVDAFWEWWPYLRKTLKVLRITGGEPLLQQNFWKWLDKVGKNDECKDMIVQVNSNLNIKNKLVQRLVEKVDWLLTEEKIAKFALFTSIESWGERASYTRNGLDIDLFEQNLATVMHGLKDHKKHFAGVTIMNTFNIMCVTSYIDFLKKILEWRKQLHYGIDYPKLLFDIPHCTEPNHWTLYGLPDEYTEYFDVISQFVQANSWSANAGNYVTKEGNYSNEAYHYYFNDTECAAWDRVVAVWEDVKKQRASVNPPHHLQPKQVDDSRRNWFLFIRATDKRRGTDLKATFPEMSAYYDLCASLEDIADIDYNSQVKAELLKEDQVEFHWDDDFVWHHPALAQTLINYRKAKELPTIMHDKDVEVGRFGNTE